MLRTFVSGLLFAALSAVSVSAASAVPPSDDLAVRRKALGDLLAEHWEYTLSTSPEFASLYGDKRWNDKLSDLSEAATLADQKKDREWLARLEAIDTTGFPEQEALAKILLVRSFKESIANEKFHSWEMPVSQFGGIHLNAPQLVSLLSFMTVKDYDDYAARLKQMPRQFDDVSARMRKGMADGLMQPRFLLEKVVTQAGNIAAQKPEDTPFAQPLAKMPAEFSAEDRKRIRETVLAAVRDDVLPAYVKFTRFVKEEYAPKGRTEPGMWSLPDGPARYAAQVKRLTTTDKTPDEIHAIGLAQVAAIEKEMLVIAKKKGFPDLKSFNASIEKDPNLHYRSREAILTAYRQYIRTWSSFRQGFPHAMVYSLALDSERGGVLYAGTTAGVFRQEPGGVWSALPGDPGVPAVTALLIDHDCGRLLMGTFGAGVFAASLP